MLNYCIDHHHIHNYISLQNLSVTCINLILQYLTQIINNNDNVKLSVTSCTVQYMTTTINSETILDQSPCILFVFK